MTLILYESFPPRFSLRVPRTEEDFVRGNPKWQNPMFYVANVEERATGLGPKAKVCRRIAGADETPKATDSASERVKRSNRASKRGNKLVT